MRRALVLLALLLFAGAAFAQPAQLAPCLVAGTDCSSGSGVSGLTSGRVTLSTGATTVGDDAGLTKTGTGTGLKLGIGTDVFLSRASAGTLLVEDGSGNARDVQARTGTFGTSVVAPTVTLPDGGTITGGGASLSIASVGGVPWLYPTSGDDLGQIGRSDIRFKHGFFAQNLYASVFASGTGGKTGTNVAGTNNVVQAEPGTGSATGSSIIFQTPTAGASGTTAQTQTTRLTIGETGAVFATGVRIPSFLQFESLAYIDGGSVGGIRFNGASAVFPNGTMTPLGKASNGWASIHLDYTNTATVGAVTMNKPSGRVILAAGASSVVVTNSLATAAAHVFVTRRTNDATALFSYLTSTAGSFTIFATAAATADTEFDFLVIGAD